MSSDEFLDKKSLKKLDFQLQNLIDRIGIDRKTQDEVFDISTLHTLEKLISDKVLNILDFPISTGKEGNVFRGITPDNKLVAVKIYRISTSTFKHISNYILGDPRFKSIHRTRRDIIISWTKKEFKNLERLEKIGVRAPKPITKINNVLVMEYIGSQKKPAPLLKDVILKNPEDIFNTIIGYVSKMYQEAELVHSDLSAYNVIIHRNKPYLIDLGQGVLIEHPNAHDFLKRDIHNIVSYFKKYNIFSNENKIYTKITKKKT
jgi:RIO kinase 1